MRKLFTLTLAVIAIAPTYADNITDGLAISGDHVYSYTPIVQTLCLVLASIIGVVGGIFCIHILHQQPSQYEQEGAHLGRQLPYHALHDACSSNIL